MDNANKVGHLQKVQFKDYYRPHDYIESPGYTSMNHKKDEHERYWRNRGSLLPYTDDHNKDRITPPSLKWISNKYEGGHVKSQQKQRLLKELQSCEGNFDSHVEGQARLENRENAIYTHAFKSLNKDTYNIGTVKQNRIKEMVNDMTTKFGNQVVGVHGRELPKFMSTEQQMYWTSYNGYSSSPKFQSQNEWQQNNKYWAENDQIKIHDNREGVPPIDSFKREYHALPMTKYQVSEKPTGVNHWKNSNKCGDPSFQKGFKPNLKWSDKEATHLCSGKNKNFRTFEKIVSTQLQKNDDEAIRESETEKLIIKQAPRSLQAELAFKIQQDKLKEQTMLIGFNRSRGSSEVGRIQNPVEVSKFQ